MDDSFTAEIKAKLISIGSVRLDPALELPEYVGRSTAGPCAGGRSVFFTADSRRVRLSIRDNSPLFIRPEGDGVAIFHDGSLVATGMLETVGAHCPPSGIYPRYQNGVFSTVRSARFTEFRVR